MPTYHARGISARLGTLPLSDATTPNIVIRKGDTARQQAEVAEQCLRTSKLLKERAVPFPGDKAGFELNWLGNTPFMQAEVAQSITRVTNTNASSQEPHAESECKPEALVLHIQLSDKTFTSGLAGMKTSLKVEVLFNGALVSCVFISTSDIRSGAKPLHQILAGTRVDYLSEQPWIIMHDNHQTDDSSKIIAEASPVELRWQKICEALQCEVQARGMNGKGDISPSSHFLTALASMQMPRQVCDMQRPGGMHFGVIDVVISAGDGRKTTSGAGYLKAPRRLKDANFPLNAIDNKACERPQEDGVGVSSLVSPKLAFDNIDAEGESESDSEPVAKRRAMAPRVLSLGEMQATSNSVPALQSAPLLSQTRSSPDASSPPIIDPSGQIDPSLTTVPSTNHRQPPGSPKHHSTLGKTYNQESRGRYVSASELESPSLQQPAPESGPKSAPQLPPSSWNFYSDSLMLRQPPYSKSESLLPFAFGQRSSPAQGFGMSFDGPFQPSSSSPFVPTGHDMGFYGNSHDSQRHPSHGNCAPFLPAPIYPWQVPRPPHLNPIYAPRLPNRSLYLPFSCRSSSAGMPPLGHYTVPQKPKASTTMNKIKFKSVKSRQSILINRLVVYGRNGPIIDHRWPNPRRLSSEYGGGTLAGHSPIETLSGAIEKGDDPTRAFDLSKIDPSLIPNEGQADKATTTPEVQSDVTSGSEKNLGSEFLGIQGPKAATFWIDDPEELLRRPLKRRRSISPPKQDNLELTTVPLPKVASSQDSLVARPVSSSPLSSAPTTPEPPPDVALPQRSERCESRASRADESCGSAAVMNASSTSSIPSSTENPSHPEPHQVDPKKAVTTASKSKKRKRKSSTKLVTKSSYYHQRVLEVSDSPLNDNCVVTFADADTVGASTGPLRQVKSERQGTFQEDYVVFTARFFVPGN